MIKIGDKWLITTDNYFFAPNGQQYRSVWGTIKGLLNSESTLGIETNVKSTNWYVEIGNMVIAGCQIHYAVQCDTYNENKVDSFSTSAADGLKEYQLPCAIYNADI